MAPWIFSSDAFLSNLRRLDFVTPGSLLVTAESRFSSHRCSFLFGAGGIVAGVGIESNLGNDVILDSPAFTRKTPTPPANVRTG